MGIEELKIPLKKLLDKELQSSSILIYGVLLYHAYKNSNTWITNYTISKESGVSQRTVGNALKELKDKECIKIEYRNEGRFQVRYITPLILFEIKLVPNNYVAIDPNDNGGFEEL